MKEKDDKYMETYNWIKGYVDAHTDFISKSNIEKIIRKCDACLGLVEEDEDLPF